MALWDIKDRRGTREFRGEVGWGLGGGGGIHTETRWGGEEVWDVEQSEGVWG